MNNSTTPYSAGQLMTLTEVATYLHKPSGWVYENWRSEGIPFKRVGNQLRCRFSDLEKWLDRQAAE
ncbi:DNA-binding protein [Streptomyces radicis]|uniref:DNA-binding protein n=3 Tax=Streptomyces radicis TaxID=1750517 RepID=A0A3A9WYQ7_9ACTN|nr:DNA-binding protein [Streptomyces radicis]RKN27446.1 DNA-binding protein [Streptomyces radicis]